MKKALLCLSAFCMLQQFTYAQFPGYSRSYEFDNSATPKSCSIDALLLAANNQSLYFAINTNTNNLSNASKFAKTDLDGNIQGELLDSASNRTTNFKAVSQIGQYLYWFGTTQIIVGQNNLPQLKLVKTDLDLNTVWGHTYPLSLTEGKALNIKSMPDNSLMVMFKDSPTNMMHLDTAGAVLNFYNISGGESGSFSITNQNGFIIPANNSVVGYDSLIGQQWTNGYTTPPTTRQFRVSFRSNEMNERYYAAGRSILLDYSNPQMDKVIFAGSILKHDKDGNLIWNKVLPIGCAFFTDVLPRPDYAAAIGYQSIANTLDNGCVVAGSGANGELSTSLYLTAIARLDNNGTVLWNYFYYSGGVHDQVLKNIVALPDGTFIAAGLSNQKGWLLRVDSAGCYNSTCSGMSVPEACPTLAVNDLSKQAMGLNIFPNPATNQINIQSQTTFDSDSWLEVLDVFGRIVLQPVSLNQKKQYALSTNNWADGHYFLKFKIAGQLYYRKVAVVH